MLVWTALFGVLTGFIGAKVGWGRWLTYLVGVAFAALLVPIMTGLVLYPHGAPVQRPVRRHGRLGRPGLYRPGDPQPVGDAAVPALHLHARTPRLGDLDVRVVRGVRPPSAAQCGDRDRGDPAREHGVHLQRPAAVPDRVQRRLAVPAHPVACLRRAVGMDAPSDRGPGVDLVGLPPWRDDLHRSGGGGVGRAHPDGRVGATGRCLGRRRGRAAQRLAIHLPVPPDGRVHPARRADIRVQRADRPDLADLDQGGADDQPQPDRQDALLLARGDIRPDRRQGLERLDHADDRARSRRRVVRRSR